MSIFRITYSGNRVVSIKPASKEYKMDAESSYFAVKGILIYALVEAENKEDAEMKANDIIMRVAASAE